MSPKKCNCSDYSILQWVCPLFSSGILVLTGWICFNLIDVKTDVAVIKSELCSLDVRLCQRAIAEVQNGNVSPTAE